MRRAFSVSLIAAGMTWCLTGCATTTHHTVRIYEYTEETPADEARMQSPGEMVAPGEMVSPGEMVAPGDSDDDS